MSETSKETQSLTWPLQQITPKTTKRRFSWENITKTSKDSKLSKLRRKRDKFNWLKQSKDKKSSSKSTFKTSTPLKGGNDKESSSEIERESSFGNSTAISQVNFMNKSNEAQLTTCSDRLGTPKTSLNEFKKLLLNATNKRITTKPSAVEQLRLKQEALNATPMKILDLSASPKSFTNRRVFQQPSSSSPYKKPNLMSPRSRWKYNNFNKSTISSIPEGNAEDETNAIETKPTESNTPIYATPKRNPTIPNRPIVETNVLKSTPVEPIIAKTESSPETGIIETNFSMEDNIFLLSEENNFMRGEVRPFAATISSKSIQKSTTLDTSNEQNLDEPRTLETSF